jgi:hypothetical protein
MAEASLNDVSLRRNMSASARVSCSRQDREHSIASLCPLQDRNESHGSILGVMSSPEVAGLVGSPGFGRRPEQGDYCLRST